MVYLCSVCHRIRQMAICQQTHPSLISQPLGTLHDDSIYIVAQAWWWKANIEAFDGTRLHCFVCYNGCDFVLFRFEFLLLVKVVIPLVLTQFKTTERLFSVLETHGRLPYWAMGTYRWKMAISGCVYVSVCQDIFPTLSRPFKHRAAFQTINLLHTVLL